jgi:hypothetical protein
VTCEREGVHSLVSRSKCVTEARDFSPQFTETGSRRLVECSREGHGVWDMSPPWACSARCVVLGKEQRQCGRSRKTDCLI